jgi:pyridoxal phosphate enzyme (YggS family)
VNPSRHPYHELNEACRTHNATLVAVCKTRTIEEILAIYGMGQRIFAENRVQELVAKAPMLPADIEWHLIGHLQTNKVRIVLPYIALIHSLDRTGLWETLDKEAARLGRTVDCLLQIKVAREESKFGWAYDDLCHQLEAGLHRQFPNVILRGIMGMTSLTDDRQQVREELRELRDYFNRIKETFFQADDRFSILSMGMSGDYAIALEEGSTMIRVGSLLFAKTEE